MQSLSERIQLNTTEKKQKDELSSNDPTIERCPHDQENPYSIINNNLIRDISISPGCRWLIIYLLSNSKGWQIKFTQLVNHLKEFMGRDKVRSMLNEAIDAGYIKRIDFTEKGKRGGFLNRCKYYVSEIPKFKKCFRLTENQEAGQAVPGQPYDKEVTNPSKEGLKNKQYKERSADASPLTEYFIKKLKERQPHVRDPNLEKWTDEMDYLLRIDKRDFEEIKKVIDWIPNDLWYNSNILSPKSLRSNYDGIFAKIKMNKQKDRISINREYALKTKSQYPKEVKTMNFDSKGVTNIANGKDVIFDLPHETFVDIFLGLFGGSR